MTPGSVVIDGKLTFVVLACAGAMSAVAPLLPPPKPRMAGDVDVLGVVVRTAQTALTGARMQPIGTVEAAVLAECVRAAKRASLTQQIIAKHAPLRQ